MYSFTFRQIEVFLQICRAGNFSGSFKDALFQLTQKYQMLDAPLLLEFSEDGTVLRVSDQERPQ